jgi:hypothetical protein
LPTGKHNNLKWWVDMTMTADLRSTLFWCLHSISPSLFLRLQDPTQSSKPVHYQSISYVDVMHTYDGIKTIPRTPSPVESFNSNPLDPNRIFPVGGDNMDQHIMSMPMGAAEFLFHSAMSAV